MASTATAQVFVERASQIGLAHKFESGIDRIATIPSMLDWSQQGMAIGDLDRDGDNDVIAIGRLRMNHVWRCDGDVYTDVTAGSGIESSSFDSGVALGDYDRDGDLDVYITTYAHGTGPGKGQSRLLRNEGNFVFEDVTRLAGAQGLSHSLFAKFFDYDRDGLLDIGTAEFSLTRNRLFRNGGDGGFRDVSAATGFDNLGSTHVFGVIDTDGDGFEDVMVGNDWIVSNVAQLNPTLDEFILKGNGDGTFTDVTVGSGIPLDGPPLFLGSSTMGLTFGDVDYDGDFDCYKTEVGTQFLMINNGWPGTGLPWTQAQDVYGVTNSVVATPTGPGPAVGWGCSFAHFDLDPWLDLFKVNGHVGAPHPRDQQNYLFIGDGPSNSFHFTDRTAQYGLVDFHDDRGLAVGDLDRDGDLDLLIAPPAGNLRYFENDLDHAGKGSISVRVRAQTSAPDGEGSLIEWTDSQNIEHRYVLDADGQTASQNEKLVLLGIGNEAAVTVRVTYPSGLVQTFPNLAPGTQLLAEEPELFQLATRHAPATGLYVPFAPSTFSAVIRPSQIQPLGSYTVRVAAFTKTGVPVTDASKVKIEIPGLSPLTNVQALGSNLFTRSFAPSSQAGSFRFAVSFDTFTPRIQPVVTFYGQADDSTTTATASPEAVRANLADPFTMTVVPRDAQGTLLGKGHRVAVEIPGVIPRTLLTDLGDGRYRGDFTSPAGMTGFFSIHAIVDQVTLVDVGMLEVAGSVSGPQSIVYSENPNLTIALNSNQLKVLFTPRDVFGARLGSQSTVTLAITPNPGSQPVVLVGGLGDNSREDGAYYFVLEKPLGTPVNSATGSYVIRLDGVAVKTQVYSF